MPSNETSSTISSLAAEYERDFNAWIQQHITLLKQGRVNDIDVEHLILELEDMGKSNLRELESRFIILITHLFKWQFQLKQLTDRWQEFEGKSWKQTIIEQRLQIRKQLKNTPSLKSHLQNIVIEAYPYSVELATDETGLPESTFPNECPYGLEQLLDKTFYPN
jgi:hypothetical protein